MLGQVLRERYPDVGFLAQEMWNAQLSNALLAGEIDVAVTRNPDLLPSLGYETIRDETLVAIVPRDHALAGQSDVRISALAGERLLLFPRSWHRDCTIRCLTSVDAVGRQNLARAQIGDADGVLELLWLLFTTVRAAAHP